MADQLRSLSIETEPGPPPPVLDDAGDDIADRRRPRRWRWAVVLGLALGGAAASQTDPGKALFLSVQERFEAAFPQPPAPPAIATAAPAPVGAQAGPADPAPASGLAAAPRQIIGSGYSRAERDVILGAPLPGRIAAVEVAEGAHVTAGASLVRLDERAARDAVDQAALDVTEAELALRAARLQVAQITETQTRLETLVGRGAASASQATDNAHALAAAEVGRDRAELALRAATARHSAAEADLAEHSLVAPFDGVVAALLAAPGMMTAGEQSDALLRLFDPASVVVDVEIAERSLGQIAVGQSAEIVFDALSDARFAGAVSALAPIVSRERGTLRVTIRLDDPPAALRPNMAARATLFIEEQSQDQQQSKGDNDV